MGGKLPYTLAHCKALAESRGGKCLSTTYHNIFSKMQWRCANGHTWTTSFNCIKNKKSWCPDCTKYTRVGQELCRYIFEYIFNSKFERLRPKWLVNPNTGRRLELDGYNNAHRIAFEYQGAHHYKKFAYMDNNAFVALKSRDALKLKLCKEHSVKLFVIPSVDITISHNCILNHFQNAIGIQANVLKSSDICKFLKISFPDKIIKAETVARAHNMQFLGIKSPNGKYQRIWLGVSAYYWYRCNYCKKIYKKSARRVHVNGCRTCITRKRNEKNFYSYEVAKDTILKLGITSSVVYRRNRYLDSKLPANPSEHYTYKETWLGWDDFLARRTHEKHN